jgi:hypothetical protein
MDRWCIIIVRNLFSYIRILLWESISAKFIEIHVFIQNGPLLLPVILEIIIKWANLLSFIRVFYDLRSVN